MYFVPLSQIESVELVIHALRAAGGTADCSQCPARKVCMKQCLTIAEAVARMAQDGTLPFVGADAPEPRSPEPTAAPKAGPGGHLKVLK
jgi:hypothetical protein